MPARFFLPTRLPITASSLAGKRVPATVRCKSTTNSSRAAKVMEIASKSQKPSRMEAAVPVMWAVCGALSVVSFRRINEKNGEEYVHKLLVV